MKNKKEENKPLYVCKSIFNGYEYKEMIKSFPNELYKSLIFRDTFINFIYCFIFLILTQNIYYCILQFAFFEIIILIVCWFKIDYFAEQNWINLYKKKRIKPTNYELEFYDNYFIVKNDTVTIKTKYSEVDKCIETDTNFYFYVLPRNSCTIIQKNNCSLNLIKFVREKISNIETLGNVKKNKYQYSKTKAIILFVLLILSLLGARFSFYLINKNSYHVGINNLKNMWIFLCWLPFPLLSTIFGFKYRKNGIINIINMILGCIITLLFLTLGLITFFYCFT